MQKNKSERPLIIICLVLFVVSVVTALIIKPDKYDISKLDYANINAKVIQTNVRQIKSGKYSYSFYYDVTIEFAGQRYVWTKHNLNPRLQNGMYYDFILYNGKVYRNEKELQHNMDVINSPIAFRVVVLSGLASFSLAFNCIIKMLLNVKKKKKSDNTLK